MLCVTTIMSAANYDLWICGKQVTSSNASDVMGTKAVSYNASSKTLTLNQTYLESSTDEIIYSKIEGLTIKVTGTVYLRTTNKDKNTVSLQGTTTITGTTESSLTVTRYDAAGTVGFQPIRANCNIEINNITMKVSNLNGGSAIRPLYTPDDSNPSNYTLTVKNADVTFVAGGTYYPIYGFKNVVVSGCSLNPMTYYKTDANSYYVADNSGKGVTGKDIVIKKRKYGSFGGVTLDDSNIATDIKPKDMTKGTVKFYNFRNGAGKYLYLENVEFSSTTNYGIHIDSPEPCHFEVILMGDNHIKSSVPLFIASNTPGSTYVKASQDATKTPYLKLEATASQPAVDARCPDLNFNDIILYATSYKGGGIDGFQDYDNVDHTLRFTNADATIIDNSPSRIGAIVNFKSVSYTDSYLFNQNGNVWNNKGYNTPQGQRANSISIHRGYGISINDYDVTKKNKNDVCGDGKVSYDPSTKTLYLKGVNYKTYASPLFIFTPTTINLTGKNTLTTVDYVAALNVFANTTVVGGAQGATLAANNEEGVNAGILVNQSALTIKDCEVSVYSPKGLGVRGRWALNDKTLPGTSTLALNNASLVINNSTTYSCIENFKSFTMTDCYYERPTNARFDPALGLVMNDATSIGGNLEIRKGYGILVGGTRVTKDNASNVMSGVSYDASTNTLKFNNGKVSSDTYGILAYKNLNLYVSGTANTIASTKSHAILAYGDVNITGPGKSMSNMALTTNGQNCAGIYMNKSGNKFSVKNTTLSARATNASSYGIVGSKTAATIQDAEVTAYGTSASIYSLSSLSMIGVDIITPAGAVFTPGVGVTLNGATVAAKDVTIGVKDYEIGVGGTKITSANCADVFGDGRVKFEPSSNTLTLNSATIATEGYGIDAQSNQRLYINLIGTSYVNSLRSYALYHNNTNGITIQSSSNGTLNLSGSYIGSYQTAGNLTIKNCTVKSNGIQGMEGNNYCTLNIENANVTSDCSYGGAFKWIDNILLTSCYVSEPTDAVFNRAQGGYLSGNTVCPKVVIKAGTAPSAIDGVTINGAQSPTYNLRGVQVNGSHNGIVIRNGRKYIQK